MAATYTSVFIYGCVIIGGLQTLTIIIYASLSFSAEPFLLLSESKLNSISGHYLLMYDIGSFSTGCNIFSD
jgi:hypothetical protein